ncbi:hypothetical protein BBI09_18730 [Stutzerimonas xanthomarina]|uniref:hypothetical protein n=1 Tax=Stutzerimonas nitrititolerans TaxID=2482751 RepID=UPI000826246B|nr:hypothetical protein [Stutzerimonas nitrititolerans]MBA1185935.1 hypothetical protein [Stutzerimonas stutzeri]OCX11845.1 hypothetical protein BBI09_18730 [Stutzerimonas xanthomarina]HBB77311.1 hypothetical protein [Pseudomonas sp.]
MMKRFAKAPLALLALLSSSLAAQAACDYDDFPKMDDMLVASLGGDVQWNNMPLAGRSFRVPASVEQVKAFYSRQWRDEVDFTRFNDWEQILHVDKRCLMMVQVKPQNQRFSYGRMLLTNPPTADAASRPLGSGMPVPHGAQVISDMRSDDAIRKGRMVLLLNEEDLHVTRAWYEAELRNQGWTLEERSNQPNAVVLSYAKGRELMSVGLLRHQDVTQVLLNRMDR